MKSSLLSLAALIVASLVLWAKAGDAARQGKLGDEVSTAQWIFQVYNITETDEYAERYNQEARIIRPQGKNDMLIVIEARLKNALRKVQSPVLTERMPGNTGLVDEEGRSYQPLDVDARQAQNKIMSYEGASVLPGAVADFALVFSVPRGTKPKTLHFTCSTYLGEGTDVQVSLTHQDGGGRQSLQIQADRTEPVPGSAPLTPPTGIGTVPTMGRHQRALLIGNAAYADSPLRNPINDADGMAGMLQRLGFEVALVRDADKPTMEQAIGDFTRGVPRGTVGLFFFSGHGAQIDGLNYLLPVGRMFTQPTDVKYHAVAADWILGRMDDTGMEVKLLILDACRNNPFGRSWSRAVDRGLAVMDAPKGSLIAYATSPKKTASDGASRHSPYTANLLREIPIPGRPIELVFKAVRVGVQQETEGEQTPWEASSLTGEFYFAR